MPRWERTIVHTSSQAISARGLSMGRTTQPYSFHEASMPLAVKASQCTYRRLTPERLQCKQSHSHTPHSAGRGGRISNLSTWLSNSLQLAITQTLEGLYAFHCLLSIVQTEREVWRLLSPSLSKNLRTLFPAIVKEQVCKNKGFVETNLSQNWTVNSFLYQK